jgi:hypothetical protein
MGLIMLRWLWNRFMKWGWDFNHRDREEVMELPTPHKMSEPTVRLNLYPAMNGRVLEIATPNPNAPRHDWNVDVYIITEGEILHDILSRGVK